MAPIQRYYLGDTPFCCRVAIRGLARDILILISRRLGDECAVNPTPSVYFAILTTCLFYNHRFTAGSPAGRPWFALRARLGAPRGSAQTAREIIGGRAYGPPRVSASRLCGAVGANSGLKGICISVTIAAIYGGNTPEVSPLPAWYVFRGRQYAAVSRRRPHAFGGNTPPARQIEVGGEMGGRETRRRGFGEPPDRYKGDGGAGWGIDPTEDRRRRSPNSRIGEEWGAWVIWKRRKWGRQLWT